MEVTAERQGNSLLAMRIVGIYANGSEELLADFDDIWQVIQNGL
ncbi:hypothetical protein L529_4960 [Bordetella bronchiseptica MBORD901]|nr:hypothetical protein L529_4960 [Bordetella bronchiseptica MBORD901]